MALDSAISISVAISQSYLFLNELSRGHDYQFVWYHVYRANALQVILQEVEAYNFSDLNIVEAICSVARDNFGKITTRPSVVCHVRQKEQVPDFLIGVIGSLICFTVTLPHDYRVVQKISGDEPSAFSESILDGETEQFAAQFYVVSTKSGKHEILEGAG